MPRRPDRRSGVEVYILGAGKVGRALHAACRSKGIGVTLRPARRPLPPRIDCAILVLAVRDRELHALAERIAAAKILSPRAVCVHAAGALDAAPLAPLAAACAGVAQMHPMISFASLRRFPSLARGNVHVQGDRRAVARARSLASRLGMTPRSIGGLDPVGYHAAAGLVANGAAALAAIGVALLGRAGVTKPVACKMLGPLLRSVADNVEALGFPDALTGPVRRGDPHAIERAIGVIEARLPGAMPLFLEAGLAQLPLARELGEGPPGGLDAIEAIFRKEIARLQSQRILSAL